ncbi:hypothetical protein Vadar_006523 [Vaccinium darrowii]|uniref:Uncharacterized protein n=1 Tax=Vaccinium darrowii TaxID=229202 RepID=A0ACB7WYA1_9ERIC|nr:hypothetical protein Vadar_006523 [Vaccinium darrowii]
MAAAIPVSRSLLHLLSRSSSPLSLLPRLLHHSPSHLHDFFSNKTVICNTLWYSLFSPPSSTSARPLCSTPKKSNTTKPNPKLTNFSLSDSDSDSEPEPEPEPEPTKREIDKTKLPPPYDPFNKKPAIEEPDDPTNLQEVFHKIRTEGLFNNAVKMFDGLSKDGLTHEALELFKQIKDKGHMPDVVGHTAVIEAYINAGQVKEGLKVYKRMLGSGVMPNAYTYSVLVKGLAGCVGDGKMVEEGRRVVAEMMGKGVRVNAETCVAVVEGVVREGGEEEGRRVVEEMKRRGDLPEEKEVREVLKGKRGPAVRSIMSLLFGK